MDVSDTNPLEKCCSRCTVTKNIVLFIPKRNICKQIEQHYKNLVEYHTEHKLDLPQVYIDLFAT